MDVPTGSIVTHVCMEVHLESNIRSMMEDQQETHNRPKIHTDITKPHQIIKTGASDILKVF